MKGAGSDGRNQRVNPAARRARPRKAAKPGGTDPTDSGAGWETRLCELELRLTQLEAENVRLRSALQQQEKNETQAQAHDFAAVGLLTLNARGMILDLNRAGANMLRATKRKLLNRNFATLVRPSDLPAYKAHLRRCRQSFSPVVNVLNLRIPGGLDTAVQVSSLRMLGDKSRVTQIKTTLIDITERHQAEKARLVSEHNLHALIDASPHPIQFKDGAGRWLLANPAMLELFGLTGVDYHWKRDAELAELSERFAAALEEHRRKDVATMAGGHTTRQDEVIRNPDGSARVIDFIKVPLREPDGQLKGLLTLGYDITKRQHDEQRVKELNEDLRRHANQLEEQVRERTALLNRTNTRLRAEIEAHQKAERALRESQATLQAIIQNSPSRIFLKDIHGRYLHFNQRFEQDLNLRLADAVGKTDAQIFPPEQAAILRNNDLAVISAASPIVFDEVVTYKDGTHTNIVTKFPLFDAEGKVSAVGGIVTDITERKRLEEEILSTSEREQRRIAQDLHDGLGQQLTGLWCLAEVLRKDLAEESPAHAPAVSRISKMLKSVVGQTRDLARGLHPVEAEPTGLMSALEALASRVSDLFQVKCEFDCPKQVLMEDKAVATQLYRIAQEAATNSIKHGRAQNITIGLSASNELILLAISDNGVGFKKTVGRNRGLGMRIMSHRAGLIGGTLIVQKRSEGGVKVVCAVGKPLAAKSQADDEQKTAET